MKIKRHDINPIKMSVSPLKEIIDAGWRVIDNDIIFHYVGIGWIKERDAGPEDYKIIPEVEKE